MKNLVSVIMPTYNRSNYLPDAIESVINQTFKNFELIVVDDGSTDNTRDVVSKYSEKVKYIYQPNSGLSSALNTGIKSAKGNLIAFLDDDDLWVESMLEKTVTALVKAKEGVGAAYVDCRYFKDSKRNQLIDKGVSHFSGDIFEELLENNFIPVNTVLVKRKCIEKVGGFDENLTGYMDWDLLLRIAFSGFEFEFINEPLALIRVHGGHMSSKLIMMKRSSLKVIEKLEKMPDKSREQKSLIKRTLVKRHLALGWYLTLNDCRDEGREEIKKAEPVSAKQVLQKMIAAVLTSIPNTKLLQKINTLIETIFGQRNPYRVK